MALVDSISPQRTFIAKHVVHIVFAGDLSGRSLEAVTSSDAAARGHRLFLRDELDTIVVHLPIQRFLRRWEPGDPAAYLGSLWAPDSPAVPPLKHISIQGYRAARELEFEPGSVRALVGEASSGKSTVLTAVWTLLEAAAPPPTTSTTG